MKIYMMPKKFDYSKNSPQGELMFELPTEKFDFHKIISWRDLLLKPCICNEKEGWCQVEEVKFEDFSKDAYNCDESQVICPVCGYHFDDIEGCDGEIECENCGAHLEYEVEVKFSTYVKKLPEIRTLGINDYKGF